MKMKMKMKMTYEEQEIKEKYFVLRTMKRK